MEFIRLDMKGHWKGIEHKSRFVVYEYEEDERYLEEGISCYSLENKEEALENLYRYWMDVASLSSSDMQDMQITIFEGEKIGEGSDCEDLATCNKTLKEIDAVEEVFDIIYDAKEKLQGLFYNEELEDYEEITREEYSEILNSIEL